MNDLQPGSMLDYFDAIAEEPPLICDFCDQETDTLDEVWSRDPSVGYVESAMICEACTGKRERR